MATSTSGMNDTINSVELLVKTMATNMKSMEMAMTGIQSKAEALESVLTTTQSTETKVDGLELAFGIIATRVKTLMDLPVSIRFLEMKIDGLEQKTANLETIMIGLEQRNISMEKTIVALKDEMQSMASRITTEEEASRLSFQTVCEELVKLASIYSRKPQKTGYREEISNVSGIVAPSSSLRTFLTVTTEISEAHANKIIKETKDFHSKPFFDGFVTPTRLMCLKRGLVLLPRSKQQSLEYRSLIDFIRNGCERLKEKARGELMDDFTCQGVVEEQLFGEKEKLSRNHQGEVYEGQVGVSEEEVVAITRGWYCINGFRGLDPSEFPNLDNFDYVLKQLALVCRCSKCEPGEVVVVE
jgi:hypothetical protein